MNDNREALLIRPARTAEMSKLAELIRGRLPDLMKPSGAAQPEHIERSLASLLPDETLVLAIADRHLVGLAALNLDQARVLAMYLDPKRARADVARRLISALERKAASFGIQRLECTVKPQAWGFMERIGYQARNLPGEGEPVQLFKSLLGSESAIERRIAELHRELGIPHDYGVQRRLTIVPEAGERVSVGLDIFNRETQLTADAARAWQAMRKDAIQHDVRLELVSGYRSVAYQAELLKKKLAADQPLDRILRVTAAPGYSEHHSGNALDLTTHGVTPLSQDFSNSRAYDWLRAHARLYGFRESYPNHNRHGIEWEPWHWCYREAIDPKARD
jgi:D-alanyl-D-alanine carboxypeptidase